MFTSAEIGWAAHDLGISEGSLATALKAHPAAICCLPMSGANCRPSDQADLINLAKQVEALAHKAGNGDADGGKGNDHDADDRDAGKAGAGKPGAGQPGDGQPGTGKPGPGKPGGDNGKGHDKSGCWHAS